MSPRTAMGSGVLREDQCVDCRFHYERERCGDVTGRACCCPMNGGHCRGTARNEKNPTFAGRVRKTHSVSPSPRRLHERFESGRSSDSRIILLAAPSHPASTRKWLICGFRPRLQRRDRSRFKRDSLLDPKGYPVVWYFLLRELKKIKGKNDANKG